MRGFVIFFKSDRQSRVFCVAQWLDSFPQATCNDMTNLVVLEHSTEHSIHRTAKRVGVSASTAPFRGRLRRDFAETHLSVVRTFTSPHRCRKELPG